ncbi:MAG: S24 family peptidase [Bacteroidota bacterium]
MNKYIVQPVKRPAVNYRVQRPAQTGFSSPATHYSEPRIDLNDALIRNKNATFYVRLADDGFAEFNIHKNDVLIVDKSISGRRGFLALIIKDGEFKIERLQEQTAYDIWGVITHIIKSVAV